jgi:hypothetical protein
VETEPEEVEATQAPEEITTQTGFAREALHIYNAPSTDAEVVGTVDAWEEIRITAEKTFDGTRWGLIPGGWVQMEQVLTEEAAPAAFALPRILEADLLDTTPEEELPEETLPEATEAVAAPTEIPLERVTFRPDGQNAALPHMYQVRGDVAQEIARARRRYDPKAVCNLAASLTEELNTPLVEHPVLIVSREAHRKSKCIISIREISLLHALHKILCCVSLTCAELALCKSIDHLSKTELNFVNVLEVDAGCIRIDRVLDHADT